MTETLVEPDEIEEDVPSPEEHADNVAQDVATLVDLSGKVAFEDGQKLALYHDFQGPGNAKIIP